MKTIFIKIDAETDKFLGVYSSLKEARKDFKPLKDIIEEIVPDTQEVIFAWIE